MTDAEIKKLIFVTKAAYPSVYNKYDAEDLDNLLIAWRMCLADYTYDQASKGLMAYMRTDTKGFPPVAGQIIEQIQKLCQKEELLPSQAWDRVMRGIRNGTYGAEEEYDKLPSMVQKAIGSPQYLRDCAADSGFNEGVAKGQFEKNYAIVLEREKYNSKLPISMRIETQERTLITERIMGQ